MNENLITTISREYAEELSPEDKINREMIELDCMGFLGRVLNRFYLVEKSKVIEEYKKACESVNKHSATTGCLFFVGQKQTIENLFPNIAKEVDS